jgi:hypothetical protein
MRQANQLQAERFDMGLFDPPAYQLSSVLNGVLIASAMIMWYARERGNMPVLRRLMLLVLLAGTMIAVLLSFDLPRTPSQYRWWLMGS